MFKTRTVRHLSFGVLLLVCELVALGQKAMYPPIFVNPHDEQIVIEKGMQLAALTRNVVSTKSDSVPEIVIASDLMINGVIVVQRGEHVQFSNFVTPSTRFGPSATMTLYFNGAPAVDGTFVPVTGKLDVCAPPSGCMDGICYLLEGLAKRGPEATIPAGTLVGLTVESDMELPAMEIRFASASIIRERFQSQSFLPEPNLFLYATGSATPSSRKVKIDSKSLVNLESGAWTCSILSAGEHEIQIDHERFILDVDEKRRYYLKLLAPGDSRVVLETHGFEAQNEDLEFHSIAKSRLISECWN